jgi:hypothetical protein
MRQWDAEAARERPRGCWAVSNEIKLTGDVVDRADATAIPTFSENCINRLLGTTRDAAIPPPSTGVGSASRYGVSSSFMPNPSRGHVIHVVASGDHVIRCRLYRRSASHHTD